MKAFKYILVLGMILAFASCEKETENISRVTYYVDLTLNGDATLFVAQGGSFTDPGATAIEGGEDVSAAVVVTGSVDVNTCGLYTLTYSATNADGFAKTVTRTVVVYNESCPIQTGFYDASVVRLSGGAYSGYSLLVLGLSSTTVYIEDLLGGFYYIGRAYGTAYAAAGVLSLSGSSLTLSSGGNVAGWGDAVDSSTGTYDSATGQITFTTNYAGMVFNATLNN